MTISMDGEFAIERYKYIMSQKAELSKTTFKIVTLFQGVIVLLAAAQYTVVKDSLANPVLLNNAWKISLCLGGIVICVSVLSIALLSGGIAAWNKYKVEEALICGQDILLSTTEGWFKKSLSWYETYIILAILFTAIGYGLVLFCVIMPILR